MRNFANHAMLVLMWVVLAAMIYAIYGVMSQPMVYAGEPQKLEILDRGYMPDTPERPQIDSKRFSVAEGYIYRPETGRTHHVVLRSYTVGNQTYYTGRIARMNMTVDPLVRGSLQSQKAEPLE